MSTVTCYECRKKYDYTEDGFCPRCGSFNQPRKGSYIVSANGDIVRTDGINEASHTGSFVHAEYPAEERARKKLGLDRTVFPGFPPAKAAGKKGSAVGSIFMIVWFLAVALIFFAAMSGNLM